LGFLGLKQMKHSTIWHEIPPEDTGAMKWHTFPKWLEKALRKWARKNLGFFKSLWSTPQGLFDQLILGINHEHGIPEFHWLDHWGASIAEIDGEVLDVLSTEPYTHSDTEAGYKAFAERLELEYREVSPGIYFPGGKRCVFYEKRSLTIAF